MVCQHLHNSDQSPPGQERWPGQDSKIAFLKQPQSYPETTKEVKVIETHMSWVFLTDRYAYKMKKPVRYDFLDFRSIAARRKYCEEELRLNRRLAQEVYLGVVPLVRDASGTLQLTQTDSGRETETIDWLVKMRRLPAHRMLDYLIIHNSLHKSDVQRLGQRLAEFYRGLTPIDVPGEEYTETVEKKISQNFRELAQPVYGLQADLVEKVHHAQLDFLRTQHALLTHRASAGRIVEGHGDLRPEHVCLEQQPVVFDCLEFNRRFRIVDPVDELASLAVECDRLGDASVGATLLQIYTRDSGDDPAAELVDFYKSCSACLRARLAIWHTRELEIPYWGKWRDLAHDYLSLAANNLPQR